MVLAMVNARPSTMLAMIGNHRNESVWRAMRGNPHLRRGLQRGGFTGGWLA